MPSTNLINKISRAVAHYLVSAGAITFDRCFPMGSRRVRNLESGPIVSPEIESTGENEEEPGNHRITISISIKGSATKNPEDTNDETERVAFNAMAGAVKDAMFLSDDEHTLLYTCRAINTAAYTMPIDSGGTAESALFAQNNADMNEFTLLWLDKPSVVPGPAEDCSWESLIELNGIACESKIAGYAN